MTDRYRSTDTLFEEYCFRGYWGDIKDKKTFHFINGGKEKKVYSFQNDIKSIYEFLVQNKSKNIVGKIW